MRTNPSAFIFSFGAWAIICGAALVSPLSVFDYHPSWSSLQAIHADERAWGVLMIVDGLMLMISLKLRKLPTRASIAAFSAIMWFLLGVSLVGTGIERGTTSIVGMYSIWGALSCIAAIEQWVNAPDGLHSGTR